MTDDPFSFFDPIQEDEFLDPANAEELANLARETGAEVLRGSLRYPNETGGWQLGDLNLSEYLAKFRDLDLVIIIAPIGKAGAEKKKEYTCGICGFVMNEVKECPRCKLSARETAKGLIEKMEENELFDQVQDALDEVDLMDILEKQSLSVTYATVEEG